MSEIGRPPSHAPPAGPPPAAAAGDDRQHGEQAPGRQSPGGKAAEPQAAAVRAPAVAFGGSLAALSRGAELSGQIIGHDGEARAILRTDHGTFLVSGLEHGVTARADDDAGGARTGLVRVRILAIGSILSAALIELDGRPLHPPPALSLILTRPAAPPPAALPAEARPGGAGESTPMLPGQIIKVTIGPPAPRPASTPPAPAAPGPARPPTAAAPPLADGTPLTLRLTAVTPPPGASAPPQAPSAPPGRSGGAADPAGPAPSAAAGHPGLRAYGTGSARAAPISGLVASVTRERHLTVLKVESPLGPFTIRTAAQVPVGSRLTFDLVALAPPAPDPSAARRAAPAPPGAGGARTDAPEGLALAGFQRGWPALAAVLSDLAQAAPEAARQVAAERLPQPNARLTTTLLLFLAALRGGDVASWLGGEAMRALGRASGGATLDRLSDDVGRLARHAFEPGPGDWRALVLPLVNGASLETVLMFVRDHGAGSGPASGQDGSRFIVELSLSRLGDLQLDGLVHDNRFDLIVRSARPLDAAIRRDIARIFAEGRDLAGLAGEIAFQVGTPFPVAPLAEIDGTASGGPPHETVLA